MVSLHVYPIFHNFNILYLGRDARALNRYNGMHKVKLRNGKRKGSEGEVRAVARCCREQMEQAPGAGRDEATTKISM